MSNSKASTVENNILALGKRAVIDVRRLEGVQAPVHPDETLAYSHRRKELQMRGLRQSLPPAIDVEPAQGDTQRREAVRLRILQENFQQVSAANRYAISSHPSRFRVDPRVAFDRASRRKQPLFFHARTPTFKRRLQRFRE